MTNNTRLTQTFIAATAVAAISSTVYAGMQSHNLHSSYALAVLALAALSSRMKVKLPGIEGNMSMNLPFLLMAVVTLSAVEAVVIAMASTLVQCWPQKGGKLKPQQMLFNLSMMALATSSATLIWNATSLNNAGWSSHSLMLSLTTGVFFLGQTVPVSAIIHISQGTALRKVWTSIVQLSFPYYVVSAGMTSMTNLVSNRFGWQSALVVFPVMYGIHLSYRFYFSQEKLGQNSDRNGGTLRTAPLTTAAKAGA